MAEVADIDYGRVEDAEPKKPAVLAPASFADILRFSTPRDTCCMALGLFTAFISGANQPAQLIIFGSILDAFNSGNGSDVAKQVSFLAIIYLLLGIQMWVTNFTQTASLTYFAGNTTKRIRELYFAALLKQNIAYFDENDQGVLSTSVIETTLLIQDGLGEKLGLAVQSISAFVCGIIVAVYYVWQLALLICATVPVILVLMTSLLTVMSKQSEASNAAYNGAGSVAQETLGAIRTIFSLGTKNREIKKYITHLGTAEAAGVKQHLSTSIVIGAVLCVMWLAYALGLWFGAYLIIQDMKAHKECTYYPNLNGSLHLPESWCITGGDVMICFFSILFGGLNLAQASPGINALGVAREQLGKVTRLMSQSSSIDPSSSQGQTLPLVSGAIAFNAVQFAYPMRPTQQVYAGLSFNIEAGQTVAFVGSSGCGKSTAVALIERFYDPDAGCVSLDGVDIKQLNVAWLRAQIGLVSQEPVLFSGSIFDNICYGREGATKEEVEAAATMANAHEFIESFPEGYDTQVGEKGIQLSGGQKQRIAIARAIVRDPKILILDEATSALDSVSEKVVQAALDNLLKLKRRTTIVIAHRLSTVRHADKILVFNSGAIVEQGTHDELMAKEGSTYHMLVNLQTTMSPLSSGVSRETSVALLADVENGINGLNSSTTSMVSDVADDKRAIELPSSEESSKEEPSIGWVWTMSAPERPYLYIGVLASMAVGSSFPLLGYFLSAIISVFFNPSTSEMLRLANFWAYMFIMLAGVMLVANFFAKYTFGIITERLATRVRSKTYAKLLELDVAWFDRPENTAGSLSQQLASDCTQIRVLTGERTSTSISQVVTLLVSLGIAFWKSWIMTFVLLGLFPIIGVAFAIQAAFIQGNVAPSLIALNEAGAVVSSAILNMRTVAAYGLESMNQRSFEKFLIDPMRQFLRKGFVTGIAMGFGQFVILSGAGLAYYVGGELVKAGRATFEDVLGVILCMMFGAIGVGQFAADAGDKAEAMISARKISGIWATTSVINSNDAGGLTPEDDVKGALSFNSVQFAYPMRPTQQVYAGLSFNIEAGQTVAFVGSSGCGKSTAVALIERFYDPDAGCVSLDGVDIKQLNVAWLRSQIGLVSQEPVLFSGSIFDNICYGREGATKEEVEAAATMANAHEFIESFPERYDTQVGEKGIQLSGGQKQRIAIARAIVRDPKILILDEATSALDSVSEKVVQAALDNLLKLKRRTTIVIAHRLSTVRHADKILVFNSGAIVEQGTHDELCTNVDGHYYAMVNATVNKAIVEN